MQNIDIYYESLKQVNDQIMQWKERQEEKKPNLANRLVNALWATTLTIFIISVVPILPALLAYFASKLGFVLSSLDLSQPTLQNFLKVWIILAALSGLLFFLVDKLNDVLEKNKRTKIEEKPPQSLSPEQYTFITIYQAYKELKVFFIGHFEQHINNSLESLQRLLESSSRGFYSPYEEAMYFRFEEERYYFDRTIGAGLMDQIAIARRFMRVFEQYDWFTLDTKTKSTLQALISFPEKILNRVENREELPAVLEILENLSKFIYAFLPEHKTYMDEDKLKTLHSQGSESLSRFVERTNNMTSYQRPQKEFKAKDRLSPRTLKEKIFDLYENIFFRFAVWFITLLILTSTMVFAASRILTLSPDTMTTVIIGTSVGGAAALAALLPRNSTHQSHERTEEFAGLPNSKEEQEQEKEETA